MRFTAGPIRPFRWRCCWPAGRIAFGSSVFGRCLHLVPSQTGPRHRVGSAHLAAAARAFEGEREAARADVEAWADRPEAEGYGEHAARVRAWCIDLGVRAAHAAAAATAGSANLLDHAAQRLFREAMLYSLTAQTRDLQAATVQRLLDRGGGAMDGVWP
ncbi:hypothetical protein ACMHYB_30105 [Sorangium sp. So ce1128]